MSLKTMLSYIENLLSNLPESWRAAVRGVIDDCLTPPNGEPAFTSDELNSAAYAMALAIRDCEILDGWEGGSFFSSRLRSSLADARAYAGLAWVIMAPPDMKKLKPLVSARADGEESYRRARAIHDLREHVRDGMPADEALSMISQELREISASGASLYFFMKTLPATLNEISTRAHRFQRSLKGWIKRAWIPLGLWMDVNNPQAVHDVMERARKCYPPAAGVPFEYARDFLPAWNKFKPTNRRD